MMAVTADVDLARDRFVAMGTTVEVLAPPALVERAGGIARMTFAQWDAELSRFRSDSELSRLNRAGEGAASPLTWEVVSRALGWARRTHGLFDPTMGAQLAALGYDATWRVVRARDGTRAAPPVPTRPGGDWRRIELTARSRRIRLPAGVALDLGGIAKGMAVDAVLHQLERMRVLPVLVNAGGDLGVRGAPETPGYWAVGVGPVSAAAVLPLKRGALATTGIGRRRWLYGGQWQHHILDPRTGTPAETGLRQVTVVAGSVEEAEVWAKAAFLEGMLMGRRYLVGEGAAGRFESSDGSVAWAGPWPEPSGGTTWRP